jgi:hypothetical protein
MLAMVRLKSEIKSKYMCKNRYMYIWLADRSYSRTRGHLDAAGAHEVDVGAGGLVAVLEGAFLLGLAQKTS